MVVIERSRQPIEAHRHLTEVAYAARCLIQMTHPSFESFKRAFHDLESRVRLTSDASEKYFSRIENLKIMDGYR